jgi:hypothetical protein
VWFKWQESLLCKHEALSSNPTPRESGGKKAQWTVRENQEREDRGDHARDMSQLAVPAAPCGTGT